MPTGAVKRRDKLLSMMQLHCFSDLQITMEIVFLRFPHCPASRFSSGGKAESAESGCGGRTATFSQRCCSRDLAEALPVKSRGSEKWEGRPRREGRVHLGVPWSRSVSSPSPQRCQRGGCCLSWLPPGGKQAPRLARLAECGAAPVSEEKKGLILGQLLL